MVEVHEDGSLTTPSVWDLHLHHVVWLAPGGGPTFASGEEKTIVSLPQGYGLKVGGDANWSLNYMIHSLNASGGRSVYLTWEIDWVPATSPSAAGISETRVQWLDVAGFPQIYPVFDAERGFDNDGDGEYTFPDDVPTDPAVPGYEERENISNFGRGPCGTRRPSSSASVTCIRAACTSTSRSRATAPTRAPRTATTLPRSGRCSAPTRATTSPRAPSAGT